MGTSGAPEFIQILEQWGRTGVRWHAYSKVSSSSHFTAVFFWLIDFSFYSQQVSQYGEPIESFNMHRSGTRAQFFPRFWKWVFFLSNFFLSLYWSHEYLTVTPSTLFTLKYTHTHKCAHTYTYLLLCSSQRQKEPKLQLEHLHFPSTCFFYGEMCTEYQSEQSCRVPPS